MDRVKAEIGSEGTSIWRGKGGLQGREQEEGEKRKKKRKKRRKEEEEKGGGGRRRKKRIKKKRKKKKNKEKRKKEEEVVQKGEPCSENYKIEVEMFKPLFTLCIVFVKSR